MASKSNGIKSSIPTSSVLFIIIIIMIFVISGLTYAFVKSNVFDSGTPQEYGVTLIAYYDSSLDVSLINNSLEQINANFVERYQDTDCDVLYFEWSQEIENQTYWFYGVVTNGWTYETYNSHVHLNHEVHGYSTEDEIAEDKEIIEKGMNELSDFIYNILGMRENERYYQVEEFDGIP